MCGISGVFSRTEEYHQRVGASIASLAHRGPDFSDTLRVSENVSLAHSRLAIVDLNARSNQPLTDPKTGNVLIFNGEVFNFRELRKLLPNREFLTNSDTEVLLYLLSDLPFNEVVNQCNGMFAFAFWKSAEQKLILCRDRFGQKPLFYKYDGDSLLFASEAKAIAAYGIKLRPDHASIINYFFEMTIGKNEHSFFAGIEQIRNGTSVSFSADADGIITRESEDPYWSYPTTVESISYEDATTQYKSIFEDAVQLRLSDEVDFAVMLSGGLDSSSTTAFAAHLNPDRELTSISAIYPGDDRDESHFARMVTDGYPNICGQWIDDIDFEKFKSSIDAVIYHQECPIPDGSIVAQHVLMQNISDLGIKVILSGNGGDEVLAGYPSIFEPAKRVAAMRQHWKLNTINARTAFHLLPTKLKNYFYVKKHARQNLLNDNGVLRLIWPIFKKYGHADLMNEYLINGIDHWTLPNLMWYEDRNAMAASVENRCPFLDYRLVELLLKLPASHKLENGSTKRILRDAGRGIVPNDILNRFDKQGFHAPMDSWVKFVNDEFLHDRSFADEFHYLDLKRIAKAPFRMYWRIYTLYQWYRQFCCGEGQEFNIANRSSVDG